jgi:uncharacterized damage-inducible protein DinB
MTMMPDLPALFARMDAERQRSHELFAGIEPAAMVYAESGWTFKDVLNHIVAWEEEAVAALRAHADGTPYAPPLLDHSEPELARYNDAVFVARRDRPLELVLAEWAAAREQLKDVVAALTAEQWETLMVFPWSDRQPPRQLVGGMLWHEDYHRGDVLRAVGRESAVTQGVPVAPAA